MLPAGEHLLAAAKLSPLNQLAAPLLAGNARLFLAADLQGILLGAKMLIFLLKELATSWLTSRFLNQPMPRKSKK